VLESHSNRTRIAIVIGPLMSINDMCESVRSVAHIIQCIFHARLMAIIISKIYY